MNLFTEPLSRRYTSLSVFSFANLLWLLMVLGCVIFPFLIAYFTDGFWLKHGIWQEQPQVKFQREFLFQIFGQGGEFYQWSSEPAYMKFQSPDSLRVPTVKMSEIDDNLDGRADRLSFRIQMPMATSESVNIVRLALFMNYQLSDFLSLQMTSMGSLDLSTPIGTAKSCFVTGDLRFKQRELLPVNRARNIYDTPVVNWTLALTDPSVIRWQTIQKEYSSRNGRKYLYKHFMYLMKLERTVIDVDDAVWTFNRGSGEPFVLEGEIRYPPDLYEYVPSGAQVFKWAWIQYVCFFVVVYVLLVPIVGLVFKNQLVYTRVLTDSPTAGYNPIKF